MTPEEKDVLQKTYALTAENNQILMKMRKSAQFSRIMTWVYWGIIVLLTVASFYFAGPFLEGLAPTSAQINQLTSPN